MYISANSWKISMLTLGMETFKLKEIFLMILFVEGKGSINIKLLGSFS